MELNLYVVNDSDNVINKTMTNKVTININLKRDVDISSPVIILLDGQGVNYSDFNYVEIPELGRFYFVNNVQRLNHKMIQVDLVCDVLETYKNDILTSNARLMRNIKTGDYYKGDIDSSYVKTISRFTSDKSIGNKNSVILTTVGVV